MKNIAGLDIKQGLKRMAGSKKLYKKLLLRFCEKYQCFSKEIEDICKTENFEDLKMKLHTFKGVSGNLGAMELYEVAMQMEAALEEADKEKFKKLSNQLCRILPNTIASIEEGTFEIPEVVQPK